jgi:hypothetical protein
MFFTKNTALLTVLLLGAFSLNARIEISYDIISLDIQRLLDNQTVQYVKDLVKNKVSKKALGDLMNMLDAQLHVSDRMINMASAANPEEIQAQLQTYSNKLSEWAQTIEKESEELLQRIVQDALKLVTPAETQVKLAAFEKLMYELNKNVQEGKMTEQEAQDAFIPAMKDVEDVMVELMPKQTAVLLKYYEAIYDHVSKTSKTSLLRKFDANGIIPVTKRKEQVANPEVYKSMVSKIVATIKEHKENKAQANK